MDHINATVRKWVTDDPQGTILVRLNSARKRIERLEAAVFPRPYGRYKVAVIIPKEYTIPPCTVCSEPFRPYELTYWDTDTNTGKHMECPL